MTDAEMKEFLANPREYNKKQHAKAWKPYNDAVQSSSLRSVHNKSNGPFWAALIMRPVCAVYSGVANSMA
ncbi:hypothetical protein ACJRO0_14060, partial [Acetobacter oryzifermentans]|uniref:hypothetical protein n=1 Tax=Acetobacter oryzifermentans TaxID=1633874 RepID=UPI0039BEF0E7